MKYSKDEVIQFAEEEDVKFIRLTFCDVFGKQKNIAIMPVELPRAFEHGISFDASAIAGFGDETRSDLLLHPEPETLMPLPWRPEHGRVVQMFAGITYPNGDPFLCENGSPAHGRHAAEPEIHAFGTCRRKRSPAVCKSYKGIFCNGRTSYTVQCDRPGYTYRGTEKAG